MSIEISKKLQERKIINGNIIDDKNIKLKYNGNDITLKGHINKHKIDETISRPDLIKDLLTVSKNPLSFQEMVLQSFKKNSKHKKNKKSKKNKKNKKNKKSNKSKK